MSVPYSREPTDGRITDLVYGVDKMRVRNAGSASCGGVTIICGVKELLLPVKKNRGIIFGRCFSYE